MKNIKVKMHSKLKYILLASSLILFIILLFSYQQETTNLETKTIETVELNYKIKPTLNYTVLVNPNPVYDTTELSENGIYISAYVNQINVSFANLFDLSSSCVISGDYSISATMESKLNSSDVKSLWKKEYELVPKQEFKVEDNNFNLDKNIVIDYNNFNTISDTLKEVTEISSNNTLKVSMLINYTISTPSGDIVESINPKFSLPLGQKYFSIEKLELEERSDEIVSKEIQNVPVNESKVFLIKLLMVFIILLIIFLLIFTKPFTSDDLYEIKIKKIFGAYAQRLVAVENTLDFINDNTSVKTIEDLVKIADELNKPIIYRYNKEFSKINEFHVFDNDISYTYTVEYPIIKKSHNNENINLESKKINPLEKILSKNKSGEQSSIIEDNSPLIDNSNNQLTTDSDNLSENKQDVNSLIEKTKKKSNNKK